MELTRNEKLLCNRKKDRKILELGPSYNPTITRADGWHIYSLDHASGEQLRNKYRNNPDVDISRIQEVDFVWSEGTLESAIPAEHLGTFDLVIASHVIEHQPNLVGFFQSISKMLKPDGRLSLAIPDKRFCFDYFMPISLTADTLDALLVQRTRHTKRSQYHHVAYTSKMDDVCAWTQGPMGELSFLNGDIKAAKNAYDMHKTDPDAPYVDAHTWYFTPSSFKLILLELGQLGLVDFETEAYFPPCGCEFIVCLRKCDSQKIIGSDITALRMELLKQMLMEIREQTDYLIGESMDDLKRELSHVKEDNRKIMAAIERWNCSPWYSRALHKLRLRSL
jgi:SAM-dependent methyltransferase